jgi:hypothetical protein
MSRDLARIREANERAKLENETARLQAETAALGESVGEEWLPLAAMLQEGWGDIVPYDEHPGAEGWDGQPARSRWAVGGQISDREGGKNRPFVEVEEDLTAIRATGRSIATISPAAKGALNNLASYTIGTGLTYKAVAGEGAPPEDVLVGRFQRFVTQFLKFNKWSLSREKELFKRSRRDGEYFVALYPRPGGMVATRIIEPEQVTRPDDERRATEVIRTDRPVNWEFGVCTDDTDPESILGYHVRWRTQQQDTWRIFPTARIVHCKRNVDENVKRGISDFYAVYDSLVDAAKLVRNAAKGAAILSAIAMIREHGPGVAQSQVESMRSSGAFYKFTQQTRNMGSRTRHVHRYDPGTIVDVPNGQQYKPSPLASQGVGAATQTINESVLRWVGANWSMPSFMMLGGGDATAYASALVAESPFVKYCEAEQIFERDHLAELIWKAARIAWQYGYFDDIGVDFRELQALVDIHIGLPTVHARQKNEETNRHKILVDNGVESRKTWAEAEGLDHEEEEKRGAEVVAAASNPFPGGDQPGQPVPKGQTAPETAQGVLTGTPRPTGESRLQLAQKLLFEEYP